MVDTHEYLYDLQDHLPEGQGFNRHPDSEMTKLLTAAADVLSDAHAAVEAIAEVERFPDTATARISDWEAFVDAYGEGGVAPEALGARRAAVIRKIVAKGGQSAGYLRAIAVSMGYADTVITSMRDQIFDCLSDCISPVGHPGFAHVLRFSATSIPATDDLLQATLRQYLRAHEEIVFELS